MRTARKEILTALSRHVERQAGDTADPPMIMAALQHRRHFTPAMQQRYQQLAQTAPLVALFGCGFTDQLAPGLRAINLTSADPLCAEWTVIALGAQTAVALIAREHQNSPPIPDQDRRFDFALTYDRILVTAAARNLLARIPAAPAHGRSARTGIAPAGAADTSTAGCVDQAITTEQDTSTGR